MKQNIGNNAGMHSHGLPAAGAHSHSFGAAEAQSMPVGMMDVKLPEHHGAFYIQYRVNGQKFWCWKNARAMAVAIEALDLEPVIEVKGFNPIDGWETIWTKGVKIMGVDWAAGNGQAPATATEIAMKQQAFHTQAMADYDKILRNPPQK